LDCIVLFFKILKFLKYHKMVVSISKKYVKYKQKFSGNKFLINLNIVDGKVYFLRN
jgi:hypothetical protein